MNDYQLSEICKVITDGDHAAPPKVDEGVPFITIRNFDDYNSIDFTYCMFVPQDYYDNLKSSRKARQNDIIYSVVGSFGIPVLIKDDTPFVFQRHIALLRPDTAKVNPTYLFHLLRSSSFYVVADILAVGSAQRTITLTALRRTKISLPSLSIQNSIGKILADYDNLIEVNRRRIAILEEMVIRTYREWFVHFRFPGHDKTKFSYGHPSDWRCSPIAELISDYIGGGWGEDYESKDFSVGGFVIRGSDIPSILGGITNRDIYRFHKKSNIASRQLQPGDIIFEVSGGSDKQPLGRSCLITQELLSSYGDKVICASFCKRLIPQKGYSEFLFGYLNQLWICGLLDAFCVRITGISNFKFEAFLKYHNMLVPPKELVLKYSKIVSPIYNEISKIGNTIEILQQMRDRLLPQLMSGQLEVTP